MGCTCRTRKVPTLIFGNVKRPILRIMVEHFLVKFGDPSLRSCSMASVNAQDETTYWIYRFTDE